MSGYAEATMEMAHDDTMPPNAVLSERVVIGLMLWNGPGIAGQLIPGDFFHTWYEELFAIMCRLRDDMPGVDIDPVVVQQELMRLHHAGQLVGVADKCFDLIDMYGECLSRDPMYHIDRILQAAELRAVQVIGQRIAQGSGDVAGLLAEAREQLDSIRSRRGLADVEKTRLDELVRLAQIRYNTEDSPALATGLTDLDGVLNGGFRVGTLNIVGARPGVGKSLLACTVARNVAEKSAARVLYVTMELAESEVTDRLVANVGRIDLSRLHRPELLTEHDHDLIEATRQQVADWPLHIVDGPRGSAEIESVARSYLAGTPSGLLIVDFLGRTREDGKAANRERHVAMVTQSLKDLALELHIPVLAISSFSRAVAQRGGRPRMDDLRDSGNIESDADTVTLMWQDHPELRNTIDVFVAKNRNGPEAELQLERQGHFGRMVSAAPNRFTPEESWGAA